MKSAEADTLALRAAALAQRRFVVDSGWPGAQTVRLSPPVADGADNPPQRCVALHEPALLRRLAIAAVPCLAVQGSGGEGAASVVLPGARADDGAAAGWATLAERQAAVGPLQGVAAPAQEDLAMLAQCLAHDLRTPIRTSARLVDAALESATLDATTRTTLARAADAAHRSADRLDGLVHLLRIARTNLGATRIDVAALCTQLLSELALAHPHTQGAVQISAHMTLQADLQLVTLALRHLLDNACKFSRHAAAPAICVSWHAAPGFDVIAVSDNGAGFSAAHAQALFQPFQRIHLQSEFEGDGIGLALVRRVAQRHGGWAWADVGTPGWTRFMMALPAAGAGKGRP